MMLYVAIIWICVHLVWSIELSTLPAFSNSLEKDIKYNEGGERNITENETSSPDEELVIQIPIYSTPNPRVVSTLKPALLRKIPFISIHRTSKNSTTDLQSSQISSFTIIPSAVNYQKSSSMSFDMHISRSKPENKRKLYHLIKSEKLDDYKTPNFISSLFVVPSYLEEHFNRSLDKKVDTKKIDDYSNLLVTKIPSRHLAKNVLSNLTSRINNVTNISSPNSQAITISSKSKENIQLFPQRVVTNASIDIHNKPTAKTSPNYLYSDTLTASFWEKNTTISQLYLEYKPTAETLRSTSIRPRVFITTERYSHNTPLSSRVSMANGHLGHQATKINVRYSSHSHSQRPVKPLSFLGGSFRSSFSSSLNSFPSSHRSSFSSVPSSHSRTMFDPSTPSNISAQLGSSAYLPCNIRNLGNKTVSWIRNRDTHILTVGRYTFIADQRFQSWHEEDSDTWTLVVKYVQERDDGRYECQVSTEPKMSYFVYFHVVSPIVRIPGGADIHVKVGSPVSLKCVISAALKQPDYIFWYQEYERVVSSTEGRKIYMKRINNDSTEGKLVISHATPKDAGLYQCVPEKLNPANVTLHVINGEHPAAMQHGTSVMTKPSSPKLLLTTLVLITLLDKSLLRVTNTFCNVH